MFLFLLILYWRWTSLRIERYLSFVLMASLFLLILFLEILSLMNISNMLSCSYFEELYLYCLICYVACVWHIHIKIWKTLKYSLYSYQIHNCIQHSWVLVVYLRWNVELCMTSSPAICQSCFLFLLNSGSLYVFFSREDLCMFFFYKKDLCMLGMAIWVYFFNNSYLVLFLVNL